MYVDNSVHTYILIYTWRTQDHLKNELWKRGHWDKDLETDKF